MQACEYAAPETVKGALDLLSSSAGETDVLAGGTDLLSLMKERIHTPKRLVSLRNLADLHGIGSSGDGLRIGRFEANMHPLLRQRTELAAGKCARWEPSVVSFASVPAAGISATASDCWGRTPAASRSFQTARINTTRSWVIRGRRISSAPRAWHLR